LEKLGKKFRVALRYLSSSSSSLNPSWCTD
jgi:hypothetical protein